MVEILSKARFEQIAIHAKTGLSIAYIKAPTAIDGQLKNTEIMTGKKINMDPPTQPENGFQKCHHLAFSL